MMTTLISEFCFNSEGIMYVYDDATHTCIAGTEEDANVVRVSNIDPLPGRGPVRFKISWHKSIAEMLDDEVLEQTFPSRESAEKFEESIIHSMMQWETGRQCLASVCERVPEYA